MTTLSPDQVSKMTAVIQNQNTSPAHRKSLISALRAHQQSMQTEANIASFDDVGPTVGQTGPMAAAKDIGSGVLEGAAHLAGSPFDITNTLINAPGTIANLALAGADKVAEQFGGDVDYRFNQVVPVGAGQTLVNTMGDAGITTEDRGSFPRKVANYTTQGLGMTFGGLPLVSKAAHAAGKVPGAVDDIVGWARNNFGRTVAGETAAATTSAGGGVVGGEIAEDLGLPRYVGQTFGELAGGFLPATATNAVNRSISGALHDPKRTGPTIAAAERLGAPVTPGLVGNTLSARMEEFLSLNPAMNSVVRGRQRAQIEAAEQGIRDAAADLRGQPRTPRTGEDGVSDYDAGSTVRGVVDKAIPELQKILDSLSKSEMNALGGKRQPIDVRRIDAELARMQPDLAKSAGDRRGSWEQIQSLRDDLLLNRQTGGPQDLNNPNASTANPNAIDPARHDKLAKRYLARREQQKKWLQEEIQIKGELETAGNPRNMTPAERKAHDAKVKRGNNLRQKIKTEQARIDNLRDEIWANTGVKNVVLDDWRKRIGAKTDGESLDARIQARGYGAVRAAQEDQARSLGNLETFRSAVDEKRRIVGQQWLEVGGEMDLLRALAQKEPVAALDALLNRNGTGALLALRRSSRLEDFKQISADIIEVLGMPRSQDAVNNQFNTETFSPAVFGTRWHNLDKKAKAALIPDPDVRAIVDDVYTLTGAMKRRSQVTQAGTAQSLAVGTGMAGAAVNPVGLAKLVASLTAATKGFLSEAMITAIAKDYPDLAERMLRRTGTVMGTTERTISEQAGSQ